MLVCMIITNDLGMSVKAVYNIFLNYIFHYILKTCLVKWMLFLFSSRLYHLLDNIILKVVLFTSLSNTAILTKVVGKNVHATIPKGNMGYDKNVPDTV